MSEAMIEAALKPFGWTCGPEFWQRYYTDPWVFNLANAVERLARVSRCGECGGELLLRCADCGTRHGHPSQSDREGQVQTYVVMDEFYDYSADSDPATKGAILDDESNRIGPEPTP